MGPHYDFETAARMQGLVRIAGIDEAGRGPLAGPVTAAAVVLDPDCIPDGLNDSKLLTAKARERLAQQIWSCADVGVGHASVEEIEDINILRASHLAMCRAVAALSAAPQAALIDGNMLPRDLTVPGRPIIGGDALCLSIAAASIVAKTVRDAIMVDLAQQHPGYGWETNKGYGSKSHISALRDLGITPYHRRTFRPVYNILYQAEFVTD